MKNKKLTILLASALVAGAATMTGCGGENNPTPPSPPPTPTPPNPPIVETPTYKEQRLSEVKIECDTEFDIAQPLNVTFEGVDNAIGYDVRYGSINSTEEDLIKVTDLSETQIGGKISYGFSIKVDAEATTEFM